MSLRINSDLKLALGNRSNRVAILAVLLVSLALLQACSSNSSGSLGISCPGATGSYSNTSLGPGGTQWAYELSGWYVNSTGGYTPYTEGGVFVVNGSGVITSGVDDYFGSTSVTGTYSITSNGTGTINLNIVTSTGPQPLIWGITVANSGTTAAPGSFGVIEGDTFANASGAAYQQSAATLATAPSGTFVFRTHVTTSGTSIAGSQASVGLIDFASNGTVTVNDDYNNSGTAGTSSNFSGTFTTPSAGIGSLSYTDGMGSHSYDYFVIDASDMLLYETDGLNASPGLGRAEAQQVPTGGFVNASFNGSYAFGSRGDTSASGAGAVNSVGQLTASGNGNISGGSFDWARDGSPQLSQTIAASTYTLSSSGRVTTTLSASAAGSIGDVLYMVSPTRAFLLVVSDPSRVEDGSMDLQSGAFSNSTFTSQYAFVMGGAVSAVPLDRTGTIQSDGNGNLGWAEQVNSGGTGNGVCLTGTYSVSANGRTTASVSTLSSSLVFYLVSGSQAYALQGDTGTQMMGGMVNQSQPVPAIPGIF